MGRAPSNSRFPPPCGPGSGPRAGRRGCYAAPTMRTIAGFVENRPFFGALLVHVPLLEALRRLDPVSRIVL